jgi:predicted AAA+ superfamily ATPase
MINRDNFLKKIRDAFRVNPVVALLGPRQSGKTTLAHQYFNHHGPQEAQFFDLENPTHIASLENAQLTFQSISGPIVIDEIQRRPDLFEVLRVIVDATHRKKKFLILGSASLELVRRSSESLAGRISFIELTPLGLNEVGNSQLHWIRGGYPLSYLAEDDTISFKWRKDYIATFLERDVPLLGFKIAPESLRRFWMMLVHSHGTLFNASEIGKSLGISDHTARGYLDILAGTFMVRILPPWVANLKKRQIKTPKIYFRDSGVFHALLDVPGYAQLLHHPKLGASWEGYALEEIIKQKDPSGRNVYFWGVHGQSEIDLIIGNIDHFEGYEIKFTGKPSLTDSMRTTLEVLKLKRLTIVIPGSASFPLAENIQVVGLEKLS